ncbi:MAG: sulfatase-like hydrolase/transferase [Chloroflexi bacterium]|nr:sulfatase-like hydrolase/transferase [Chloroflexota bacterium]
MRPNILLIQTDQFRYDCIGAHSHALVQTPVLDHLIAEGITYSSAYTPAPVCVPSRNSMLYGCWPTRHLAIANNGTEAPRPAHADLVSFGTVLHAAGYRLTCVGNWDVHPASKPKDHGFSTHLSESVYPAWRAAKGIAPVPHTNGFWGELDPYATPEQTALAWGAEQVINQLREHQARSSDEPLFLQWNTSEPHLPNILPEPYCSQISPADVPPWPSFPDPLTNKPYMQAQQRRSWGIDSWSWKEWAPIVARYLGQISLIDAQVGRVLAALDELGLADDTLVIFTADHGDLCGGHGMIDKHYVMYEDVTHVPLILRWRGHTARGATNDAFISHAIDLAATFIELARAESPQQFVGRSLVPTFDGSTDLGRTNITSTYFGNQFGLYSQRMLRDRRYKYVWNLSAEDELYDMANDPGELTNLAQDGALREVLADLRLRLLAWLEETRDPILNMWTRRQLADGAKL